MDGRQLLELVRAEHVGLFGQTLTDEAAVALLDAAFRVVRKQVQDTQEGLLQFGSLGSFRVKRVERGQGKELVTRKVVIFGAGQVAEPHLARIASRLYGKSGKGDFARKPKSFLAEYERLFAQNRREPLRILEIGVKFGESLLMWRDYFPNAIIVGIDVRERPERIADESRIHFVQGSQDDPKALDEAARVSGRPFDIIIDDASHIGYLTKRSLHYLFPRWLKPGGHYVIEDIGVAFGPLVPDGAPVSEDKVADGPKTRVFVSHQHGVLGVVKQVIDQVVRSGATQPDPILDIDGITVLRNICIIRKAMASSARPPTSASGAS